MNIEKVFFNDKNFCFVMNLVVDYDIIVKVVGGGVVVVKVLFLVSVFYGYDEFNK